MRDTRHHEIHLGETVLLSLISMVEKPSCYIKDMRCIQISFQIHCLFFLSDLLSSSSDPNKVKMM